MTEPQRETSQPTDTSVALQRALARSPEPRLSDRIVPAELHQRLLEQYAPPSLLVTDDHLLLHVSEHAGRYLEVPAGEPSRELFRLLRPELHPDLRMAVHQAAQRREPVEIRGVPIRIDGTDRVVNVIVRPVLPEGDPAGGFFLVLFDETERGTDSDERAQPVIPTADGTRQYLEAELTRLRADLRAASERCEAQAEEAKVTIAELGLINNNIQNLMNNTDIGAIFLDGALHVKFSTPKARQVFNLLDCDAGRPLSDITSRLRGANIHDDVKSVMNRLQHVEREVQADDGRWHLMRVLPYRTTDNRIDGVVITFLDITARRHAELQVRQSEERLRLLIDSATDYAIFTMDDQGRIDSWNSGAERMFGYNADDILGHGFDVLFTPEDRAADVPLKELAHARAHGRAADERYHQRKNGRRFYCSGVTTRLGDARLGFAKIARDLTEVEDAKLALERAHDELEERVQQRTAELAEEIRGHTAANRQVLDLLRRVVRAQEDERRRISHELHDDIGQQLTALRLALEREQGARTECDLSGALDLTSNIGRDIDFIAWQLRPAVLDDLGLAAALPRFVNTWSSHMDIRADCRVEGYCPGMLTAEAEVTFYRIAQEALHNVAKHARARRVDVVLAVNDGQAVLVVEDDGVGFDLNEMTGSSEGLGLDGMRERATLVSATLQVESAPGKGTSIFLRCALGPSNPVKEHARHDPHPPGR